MSSEFTSFLSFVYAQGTLQNSPEVSLRVREISHRFYQAVARAQDDDQSAASSTAGHEAAGAQQAQQPHAMRAASNESSDNYTVVPPPAQNGVAAQRPPHNFPCSAANFFPPESLSYEVITQPTPENASFPSYTPDPKAPGNWVAQASMGHMSSDQHQATGLSGPTSFATQEPTFGRRLQRAMLLSGLELATMPNPPPDRFGAVFGFCLLFESRDSIIQRLRERLETLGQETLDYWRSCYPNLNGAGAPLHGDSPSAFSAGESGRQSELSIGSQGLSGYASQQMANSTMGQFNPQGESVKDMRLDKRVRMHYPGIDGDFLDSEEVEVYLKKHGIIIPANAEFVEVEMNPNDFSGAAETQTVPAHPVTPSQPTAHPQHGNQGNWNHQAGQAAAATATTDAITTMFTDGTATGSADTGSYNPFLCPAIPMGLWTSKKNPRKFKATINVATLVDEMVSRYVCLGKTPGIRPKDVDRALKISTGLFQAA